MLIAESIAQLRQTVRQWRAAGKTIALVPTMGNLHAGHLHLVEKAKLQADHVVVSIFVNPTQFGIGEDFDSYPRTAVEDCKKLEQIQADLLFIPAETEVYSSLASTTVEAGELAKLYCGASRTGHFSAVATIVCKLINMAQPDIAVFGEKDFQQLLIIRKMVEDLNVQIKIVGVETVREQDGLAMSSRNAYLDALQRQKAPRLYQALCDAKNCIVMGETDYNTIALQQIEFLNETGFEVDYFSICNASDLQPAQSSSAEIVILLAAKLGGTRLIDNIRVKRVGLTDTKV